MYTVGDPSGETCIYCGGEIGVGDEVYDTPDGYLHDGCFIDYMQKYAKESGWKQCCYGEAV